MLCQRCSHPLPSLADRCLRCFALNPREPMPALSIESDPPSPVAMRFSDDPPGTIAWQEPPPTPPAPSETDRFAIPPTPKPIWVPLPSTATANPTATLTATPPRPSVPSQLLAWSVDLAVLLACASLHLAVAVALLGRSADYDLLLRGPRLPALWFTVCALLAVAYSWFFTVLGGRTPGLALAGLRVESQRGGTLTVREALARAALAVPSAALGLAGFALALVDPRGQTLHDKLCGAIVVRR
jgi:uncharacterized RDD family membrane protein YckC